jgi:hypothetical protein
MSKYRSHQEFGANAPINWRDKTTMKVYLNGMDGIAPPGMKPRAQRGKRFEENTDKPQSTKWHHNYDIAMFGGTDIPLPTSQTKQSRLEGLIVEGAMERIPQVKRG